MDTETQIVASAPICNLQTVIPQLGEEQLTHHDQYEGIDIATQYDQFMMRHKQELATFKDKIMRAILSEHKQSDTYLKLFEQKTNMIQELKQIDNMKFAFTESQRKELTDNLNKKIHDVDIQMNNSVKSSCLIYDAILTDIDKQLKNDMNQPKHVIIDQSNPEYKKDYDACMAVLKPYIDKIDEINGVIINIKCKKTNSEQDTELYNRMRNSIKYGKQFLGYYLHLINNKTRGLFTIFSYLGFKSKIDYGCFVLANDIQRIQCYYTGGDGCNPTSTTDPTYPHNRENFKGML